MKQKCPGVLQEDDSNPDTMVLLFQEKDLHFEISWLLHLQPYVNAYTEFSIKACVRGVHRHENEAIVAKTPRMFKRLLKLLEPKDAIFTLALFLKRTRKAS